jgi:excisionase family DNA binding protein
VAGVTRPPYADRVTGRKGQALRVGRKDGSVELVHLIHFSGTKRSSRLMCVRTTVDVAAPEVVGTEFLTRSEVSKLLGVSPNTVTRWAREGRLPCQVTLGGHHRFDRELVEQLRKSLYRAASRID